MDYRRMAIEVESPEEFGYDRIRHNLAESSTADTPLRDLDVALDRPGPHVRRPSRRTRASGPRSPRAGAASDAGRRPRRRRVPRPRSSSSRRRCSRPGDEIVVVRPNYATNLETPRAIGADVRFVDLRFEDGWAIDPDRVRALLTPADGARLDHRTRTTRPAPSSRRPSCASSSRSSRRTRGPASSSTRRIAR